jgi:hypothetical protein
VTTDKNFKRLVRKRMAQTGESYAQARGQLWPRVTSVAAVPMWWISWEQTNPDRDAEGVGDVDYRPATWPPPAAVLAFWESGFGAGCSMVVALVAAGTEAEAKEVVRGAWEPGVGAWRFCREHDASAPPGDRFPAPRWSLGMGRWPWKSTNPEKG